MDSAEDLLSERKAEKMYFGTAVTVAVSEEYMRMSLKKFHPGSLVWNSLIMMNLKYGFNA